MIRTKKVEEAPNEEVIEEAVISPEKLALRAIIEAYKIQNPAKYELKKESLEKQLKALN